jgi:hypothetical protein
VPAAILNLALEKGSTFRPKFKYQNPDGSPINLSGYTARMHLRTEVDAETTLIELTTANGRIALGGPLGTIDFYISAQDTLALPVGTAVYDLELVIGAEVFKLIKGKIKITPEVTR